MPGIPLGILAKESLPSSFWPFMQKGQWSVETTWRSYMRSPRQRWSWWCFGRSGGVHTNLAPSNSSLSVPRRSSSDANRYCGQVSA